MSLLIPGAAQKPKEDLSPSPGDFLTQGLKPHLMYCRQILYCWATRKPLIPVENLSKKKINKLKCNTNIMKYYKSLKQYKIDWSIVY